MPRSVASEAVRRKFTGNIIFYREQYRYRQRVFLPRNINAVLNWNGTAHDQSFNDDQQAGPASRLRSRTALRKRQPRGEQIAEIYNRLQPVKANSKDEGRLKINIVGIKRTPTDLGSNGASSTRNVLLLRLAVVGVLMVRGRDSVERGVVPVPCQIDGVESP